MNINKKTLRYILVVGIFCVLFFSGLILTFTTPESVNYDDSLQSKENYLRNSAFGDPLDQVNYFANDSEVYRVFESVKFDVNTTQYNTTLREVDSVVMHIEFSNGTTRNYTMTNAPINSLNYSYTYTPEHNAPLGKQTLSFTVLDNDGTVLNAENQTFTFEIASNYVITTNTNQLRKDERLFGEVLVSNISQTEFDWRLSVVDKADNELFELSNLGDNPFGFSFIVNDSFPDVNQFYRIKLEMQNKSSSISSFAYNRFKVLNYNPEIQSSTVEFSPDSILRTEECELTFNVTDRETVPSNISVSMTMRAPNGDILTFQNFTNNDDDSFSLSFVIPATKPKGSYDVIISAVDEHEGKDNFTTTLLIQNNSPKILGYKINGKSVNESLSVTYGQDITFEFNVSDVEGVSYVKVALLNEESSWYNISREYEENVSITVRTEDLQGGIWNVYIYVTDTDGEQTSLTDDLDAAPRQIEIVTDVISEIFSWITFGIGLIIGILGTIAFGYGWLKFQISSAKAEYKKEKSPKAKKQQKVMKKEKIVSKQETDEEESEEEQKPAQRKIKRKLK